MSAPTQPPAAHSGRGGKWRGFKWSICVRAIPKTRPSPRSITGVMSMATPRPFTGWRAFLALPQPSELPTGRSLTMNPGGLTLSKVSATAKNRYFPPPWLARERGRCVPGHARPDRRARRRRQPCGRSLVDPKSARERLQEPRPMPAGSRVIVDGQVHASTGFGRAANPIPRISSEAAEQLGVTAQTDGQSSRMPISGSRGWAGG